MAWIDRYQVLMQVLTCCEHHAPCEDFVKSIKSIPEIDVVPVTRCADCALSEPYFDSQSALTCREFGCTVPKDGFCHEGKRKAYLPEMPEEEE